MNYKQKASVCNATPPRAAIFLGPIFAIAFRVSSTKLSGPLLATANPSVLACSPSMKGTSRACMEGLTIVTSLFGITGAASGSQKQVTKNLMCRESDGSSSAAVAISASWAENQSIQPRCQEVNTKKRQNLKATHQSSSHTKQTRSSLCAPRFSYSVV